MELTAVGLALISGYGCYLLVTAVAFGQRGVFSAAPPSGRVAGLRMNDWLTQAGLGDADKGQIAIVVSAFAGVGALIGFVVFASVPASVAAAAVLGMTPIGSYRARRVKRRQRAAQAWPGMIEEIRLLCGSMGRPIPSALFEVGKRGPKEFRTAFNEAERQWLLSTDFSRTIASLKSSLAEPTADATCETLLVAQELGGSDIDKRLAALGDDRRRDLQARRDAEAKQAGVRFARNFVLLVPAGMAIAGLSIGDGRAAYSTTGGQIAVVIAMLTLAVCWVWAGRLLRLPEERRVFR